MLQIVILKNSIFGKNIHPCQRIFQVAGAEKAVEAVVASLNLWLEKQGQGLGSSLQNTFGEVVSEAWVLDLFKFSIWMSWILIFCFDSIIFAWSSANAAFSSMSGAAIIYSGNITIFVKY